jgi:formate dehydrogenase gamma subunit
MPQRGPLVKLLFLGLLAGLGSAAARAQSPDETCLACHGTPDIQTMATKPGSFFVDPARHKASVHGPLGCTTCHTTLREYPHPKRIPKVDCATCHAAPPADVPKSAHAALGRLACASCHGDPHTVQRAAGTVPQQCAACHAGAVRDYRSSVHLEALNHGDAEGATCQSCHGPAHKILPAREPASSVSAKNLPGTCGACHANPDFLARHRIPFAKPVESYRLSVHGREVERGNAEAPSCSACHASHAIFPARDPRSKINHWKVPDTCGQCHAEIAKTYGESVHGEAVRRGVRGAPVCTDCHGEHAILAPSEPQSLVNPARVSSVTCGRCHADERLAQRYNLPIDKVPAFEDSYHGLALRAGSQTVANCASCHGVHNILPSSDPRSTVHPANLAATCGTCHPGAGQRFAIGPVHVRPATESEHPVVRWIRVAYLLLIPLTVGFMLLHNALDFFAKLIRGSVRFHSGEEIERMNLHFRVAHWLTALSFPVLVFTGFALKFPESWWAAPLLRWESQFALRGTIHRVAGVVLVASLVYHVVHLVASRRDRVILRHMRPEIQDAWDLLGVVRYNLGLQKERPVFGKFNYAEKIEYLAFMWGTAVMTVSGFLLWFNNFTLRHFPKWVTDAATAIHYYEAILAALSILIWHFYLVIFDPDVYPMDRAWLTGRASADHLRHSRPAYYLALLRNQNTSAPAPREAEQPAAQEKPQAQGPPSQPHESGPGPDDRKDERDP